MVVGGLLMTLWAIFGTRSMTDQQVAHLNSLSSMVMTGITTVYCGITGFILLENRRMRIQAIQPHLHVMSHASSGKSVTVDLENAGAGPAVEVSVRAWILKKVGKVHSPEPVLYCGGRQSIPPAQPAVRLTLAANESAPEFPQWTTELAKVDLPADSLDVRFLMIVLEYMAADGTSLTHCVVFPLREQPPVLEVPS